MENFFRWSGLYDVKVPKKYGQGMSLSNLTIYFDNLTTKNSVDKYNNYIFDFIIMWPIQSVTKSEKEIQMLKKMAVSRKQKRLFILPLRNLGTTQNH